MITFYLLAHGMEPDAYLSDTQSDSADEEALMCRMRWKNEKDKENYSKKSAHPEDGCHRKERREAMIILCMEWIDGVELDGILFKSSLTHGKRK
jgi:hypothetical protein